MASASPPDQLDDFEKSLTESAFNRLTSLGPLDVHGHVALIGLLTTVTAGVIAMAALGNEELQREYTRLAKATLDTSTDFFGPNVRSLVEQLIEDGRPPFRNRANAKHSKKGH